jgi:hypothetical protein
MGHIVLSENLNAVSGHNLKLMEYFPGKEWGTDAMMQAHHEYSRAGILFPSKAALEKLAKMYHVTIVWPS